MIESIKPIRLQRRRTRGFKLVSPNGLPNKYVGRPTKWGNPYPKSDPQSLQKFRRDVEKKIADDPHYLDELRGKNPVCWCSLQNDCHADIYLELANQ